MKVILLVDIKKKGKKGDILDVKDGYGSFLIKNKSAVLASSYGLNRLEKETKKAEEDEKQKIKESEQVKQKLEKEKISFQVKTGAQDKVFGSVSSKQIADALKKLGYNIDKKQIKIDDALSTLGHHAINVELHKKVVANIDVELKK